MTHIDTDRSTDSRQPLEDCPGRLLQGVFGAVVSAYPLRDRLEPGLYLAR